MALEIRGASSPQILNTTIQNKGEATTGIWIDDTSAPQISANAIKYFKTTGILIANKAKPTIRNNILIGNGDPADSSSAGLKIQDYAQPLIINNTFYNQQGNTVSLRGSTIEPTFINNIFEGTGGHHVLVCENGAHLGHFRFNVVFPDDVEGCNDAKETLRFLSQDPIFEDPKNGNYHLKDHSPCIDAADGYAATILDADSHPRYDDPQTANHGIGSSDYVDIGAFEKQLYPRTPSRKEILSP